jgi:hypothetical protein
MSTLTDEEKTAIKLADLLSDLRQDLHLIGYYFASLASKAIMIRLEEVIMSATETQETAHDREAHYHQLIRMGRD